MNCKYSHSREGASASARALNWLPRETIPLSQEQRVSRNRRRCNYQPTRWLHIKWARVGQSGTNHDMHRVLTAGLQTVAHSRPPPPGHPHHVTNRNPTRVVTQHTAPLPRGRENVNICGTAARFPRQSQYETVIFRGSRGPTQHHHSMLFPHPPSASHRPLRIPFACEFLTIANCRWA